MIQNRSHAVMSQRVEAHRESTCACRAIDAYDCYLARYPRPHSFICDDASDDVTPEPCECSCHDVSEDEYDDWCGT